jgi:hypothetical protein
MATEVVNLKISVDSSGATRSVNNLKTSLGGVNKSFGNTGAAGAMAFGRIKGAIAGLGLGLLVKEVAQTSAEFEDLQLALNAVFGGVDEGAAAFARVKDIAGKLPLDIDLITSAFTQLKGAGIEPTEELLLSFSDAASVSTDKVGAFQSSIDLFTRTMQGGLGLEELQRLQDRGLPVFDVLNEKLGITRLEVSNLGKTAEGAKQIRDALFSGFDERFGGATEIALSSLSTRFSNFGDAMKKAAVAFGGKGEGGFLDGLAGATAGLTEFIGNNEDLIAALGRLIGQGLNLVIDAFSLLFDIIRQVVEIVKAAVDTFLGFIQTIKDVATTIVEFKDKVVGKFTEMKDGIAERMSSIKDNVVNAFSDTEHEVVGGSIVPDMVNGVLAEFNRMESGVIQTTQSMTTTTTAIIGDGFSQDNMNNILVDPVKNTTSIVKSEFGSLESAISGNVSGILSGSKSIKGALLDIAKTVATKGITNTLMSMIGGGGFGGGFGGGGGGLGSLIGPAMSLFGGFFADGGKLPAGKFGIAGEEGAELIKGPATVMPMNKMGSVSPVFNFNIQGAVGGTRTGTVTQQDLNNMAGRILEESVNIMSQRRFA